MRAVLDACVLYPTVMREMLIGAAEAGFFAPVWSDRLLEEWARAAARFGAEDEAIARRDIALLQSRWPQASVSFAPSLESRLWLPDPSDLHVLATAIAGSADIIVTLNAKDFPRNILAEEGLSRSDPDALLHGFWQARPEAMHRVAAAVRGEAERLSGEEWPIRRLMKKARLPRLGKALEAQG